MHPAVVAAQTDRRRHRLGRYSGKFSRLRVYLTSRRIHAHLRKYEYVSRTRQLATSTCTCRLAPFPLPTHRIVASRDASSFQPPARALSRFPSSPSPSPTPFDSTIPYQPYRIVKCERLTDNDPPVDSTPVNSISKKFSSNRVFHSRKYAFRNENEKPTTLCESGISGIALSIRITHSSNKYSRLSLNAATPEFWRALLVELGNFSLR